MDILWFIQSSVDWLQYFAITNNAAKKNLYVYSSLLLLLDCVFRVNSPEAKQQRSCWVVVIEASTVCSFPGDLDAVSGLEKELSTAKEELELMAKKERESRVSFLSEPNF